MWQSVWASTNTDRKVTIVKALFDDLFAQHPEAEALFSAVKVGDVDSGTYRAYCVRVATAIDGIINLLDEPAVLDKQLNYVAGIHTMPGMKKEYIVDFAGSFERVFGQVSSCFDSDAWGRCVRKLTNVITSKMA